jgi:adenosylcobinamide kinase/adenosylcobinamide-phosphate guanylyltransferase
MTLIFGGAYQGKTNWALHHAWEGDSPRIFCCNARSPHIDPEADIINGLHLYLLALVRTGIDPVDRLTELLPDLEGKIVLCDDITCGVVPTDAEARAHREAVGRALCLLSGRARRVVRVFCGIGTQLKP